MLGAPQAECIFVYTYCLSHATRHEITPLFIVQGVDEGCVGLFLRQVALAACGRDNVLVLCQYFEQRANALLKKEQEGALTRVERQEYQTLIQYLSKAR